MSEKETKETKETKNTEGAIQNYIVQPVMLPILPTSGPYLTDPFNIDAAYTPGTGQINILMSFMLPTDVNPTQVAIKQFYTGVEPGMLQFYAVYSSESSLTKQVNCKFKASAIDAGGNPINLGGILQVNNMVVCSVGPKSSRGVMSSVRTTED